MPVIILITIYLKKHKKTASKSVGIFKDISKQKDGQLEATLLYTML
jgi:hypothetical protein